VISASSVLIIALAFSRADSRTNASITCCLDFCLLACSIGTLAHVCGLLLPCVNLECQACFKFATYIQSNSYCILAEVPSTPLKLSARNFDAFDVVFATSYIATSAHGTRWTNKCEHQTLSRFLILSMLNRYIGACLWGCYHHVAN
jgi:hypothetical protein